MLWTDKAQKYLKKYWKIKELKDKQFNVINELLLGKDVIGLLPTGYGKSLCYLLPPLVTKKVMFIISPLISLMDDQKEKLVSMGISCATLHGNNKNKDQELFNIIDGKIKIVYMSPEYLIKGDGLELAKTLVETNQLGFLAIDESHCISVWGQDFRPEYTKIKQFREYYPSIPILAVTATATDTVCGDISKFLLLSNPVIVRASFDRPNLYLKICEIPTEQFKEIRPRSIKITNKQKSKASIVLPHIKTYPNDRIIIYINSRKDCEELAKELNKINKNCCEAYHAGLSTGIREKIQSQFSNGDINIIISTIAFGMGIDLIVRCVIIFGSPSSIEEYYQQIGRGGRDGLPCETILYFDYANLIIAKHMLKNIRVKFPVLAKAKEDNLNKVSKLVFTNTCRRRYILDHFNESFSFYTCKNCDNCCENELIDMTSKFWPIIFNKNNTLLDSYAKHDSNTPEKAFNEIKYNYLTHVIYYDKNNKEKQIELFLEKDIRQWKTYIFVNKLTESTLPDNIKFMIPKKFIKKPEKNTASKCDYINDFDNKIKTYEKLI
jgi:RecQ family ATP-dependent DNA helicase